MFLKLFLVFTLIPSIELNILIELGTTIGPLYTLLLVILTGAVGAYLARLKGLGAIMRLRACLQQGETPAEELP